MLMVLDHIHYFFEFTGAVPLLFSQLGRLSAGLFLFCLIEGFIHTHDRRRYFLRIYLVSVGMGAVQFCCILFDFCRRPDGFYPMNQMLATFAVLLPMLQGVDWLRQKRWLRGLAALVLPFAWPFFMLMVIYPMFPQAEGWLTLLGFTVLPMHTMIMGRAARCLSWCGLLMYLCRLKSTKLEALAFAAFYLLVYGSTAVLYPGATWDFIFNQAFEWMGCVFSCVHAAVQWAARRLRARRQVFLLCVLSRTRLCFVRAFVAFVFMDAMTVEMVARLWHIFWW